MATWAIIATSSIILPSAYALTKLLYSHHNSKDDGTEMALIRRMDRTVVRATLPRGSYCGTIARTSFVIYAIAGTFIVTDTLVFVIGWDLLFLLICFYFQSPQEIKDLFYSHIGYHTFVINFKLILMYILFPRYIINANLLIL